MKNRNRGWNLPGSPAQTDPLPEPRTGVFNRSCRSHRSRGGATNTNWPVAFLLSSGVSSRGRFLDYGPGRWDCKRVGIDRAAVCDHRVRAVTASNSISLRPLRRFMRFLTALGMQDASAGTAVVANRHGAMMVDPRRGCKVREANAWAASVNYRLRERDCKRSVVHQPATPTTGPFDEIRGGRSPRLSSWTRIK